MVNLFILIVCPYALATKGCFHLSKWFTFYCFSQLVSVGSLSFYTCTQQFTTSTLRLWVTYHFPVLFPSSCHSICLSVAFHYRYCLSAFSVVWSWQNDILYPSSRCRPRSLTSIGRDCHSVGFPFLAYTSH